MVIGNAEKQLRSLLEHALFKSLQLRFYLLFDLKPKLRGAWVAHLVKCPTPTLNFSSDDNLGS